MGVIKHHFFKVQTSILGDISQWIMTMFDNLIAHAHHLFNQLPPTARLNIDHHRRRIQKQPQCLFTTFDFWTTIVHHITEHSIQTTDT